MTAPTPRQFQAQVDQALAHIRESLEALPEAYARAYEASGWKVVREGAGKISRGSVSDPTAEIVGDPRDPRRPGAQRAIRASLEGAGTKLVRAENLVGGIEEGIAKAMDRLDPHEGFAATRFPISITQAELASSVAAQVRRRERGEVE